MEIFKDIIGYDGLYQISNLGNVKSLNNYKRINEKILKPCTNIHGYFYINIHYNYIYKFHTIHRLIAIAFIPNPENKPMVNHIDGNKKNNNISNLEWVTAKENCQHSWDNKLQKNSDKRILACRISRMKKVIDTETGKIYESITSAEKELGLKNLWRKLNSNTKFKYYECS
jgi:predicted DNA-binding ArsR family transcriptional regulator